MIELSRCLILKEKATSTASWPNRRLEVGKERYSKGDILMDGEKYYSFLVSHNSLLLAS